MQESQLAPIAPKVSALSLMAGRFSVDPNKLLDTLKNTVFKGATNDELLALVVVSNEYGLNPLTKEIYAFPAKGGGIVPVVSIDGWLRMMNDHPQFDGLDYEWQHDGDKLIACTAIIHRKDRSKPVRVTEYLSECKRGTEPWKMEHRMLRHKATIQGARVAFGFSGIADEDEAANTPGLAGARDVTPKAARNVPLDPFKLEDEPVNEAPTETSGIRLFREAISMIDTAEGLNISLNDCAEFNNEAERSEAKALVAKQAETLGLTWDRKTAQFITA